MRRNIHRIPSPKLIRPNYKVCRMKWEFHLTDVDPFPSVPHGHSIDPRNKYKLDIFTGFVYEVRTRTVYARAQEDQLIALMQDEKFRAFVIKAQDIFRNKGSRLRHTRKTLSPFMVRKSGNARSTVIRVSIDCERV